MLGYSFTLEERQDGTRQCTFTPTTTSFCSQQAAGPPDHLAQWLFVWSFVWPLILFLDNGKTLPLRIIVLPWFNNTRSTTVFTIWWYCLYTYLCIYLSMCMYRGAYQCVSSPARVLPHGSCFSAVSASECMTVRWIHGFPLSSICSSPISISPPSGEASRVRINSGTTVIHHLVAAGSTQWETRNGLVSVCVSLGDMVMQFKRSKNYVFVSFESSPLPAYPHHVFLRKRVCSLLCLLRQGKSLNMVEGVYNQGYIMYLKLLWYVLGLRLSICFLVSYQFISIYSTVGIPFRKSTLCDHWDQFLAHCSHCPIVQPTWLSFSSADKLHYVYLLLVSWLVGCSCCWL